PAMPHMKGTGSGRSSPGVEVTVAKMSSAEGGDTLGGAPQDIQQHRPRLRQIRDADPSRRGPGYLAEAIFDFLHAEAAEEGALAAGRREQNVIRRHPHP